jgi:hypothetical protein
MMANDENHQRLDNQPEVVALSALCWVLEDSPRADRLLALTGLAPADLRARATDPATLAAVLLFLESHEPDLVACATALDLTPPALIQARTRLEAETA